MNVLDSQSKNRSTALDADRLSGRVALVTGEPVA